MRAAYQWPAGTCGNADFVTGEYVLERGDRIIDFERDVDVLPFGLLCIHEHTVRLICGLLDYPTPDRMEELEGQLRTAEATAELLRGALEKSEQARTEAEQALATVTKVQRARAGSTA